MNIDLKGYRLGIFETLNGDFVKREGPRKVPFYSKMATSRTVLSLAFFAFCWRVNSGQDAGGTQVQTAQGLVQGTVVPLATGGSYYSFKGIPYATPPVGNLRFTDPKEPQSWNGVRDASKHGAACFGEFNPLISSNNTSEDCLFLNVYTHSTNSSKKAPVMFWIYGGSYRAGSGDSLAYGPEFFLQKNVVLVTFNYRLGAFGFLAMDSADVPGNAGLKDTVLALKWVQKNIAAFGGNPSNVMVFGESVGGSMVSALMISPLAEGLFSKGIMMSGSVLSDFAFVENGKGIAYNVAKALGSNATDDKGVLEYLRAASPTSLVNIIRQLRSQDPLGGAVIGPVAEKNFGGVSPFFTQNPWEYLEGGGKIYDIPLVAGVNSGEGLVYIQSYMNNLAKINAKEDFGVTDFMHKNKTEAEIKDLSAYIKQKYFGKSTVGNDSVRQITDLITDKDFIFPTHRFINLVKQRNSKPVYLYYFTYNDDNAIVNKALKGPYISQLPLAAHALELGYMFNGTLSQANPDATETEMRKKLVSIWTNFAKTGNPNPDAIFNVTWPEYTTEGASYLDIGPKLQVGSKFLNERMIFWDNILDDLIDPPGGGE